MKLSGRVANENMKAWLRDESPRDSKKSQRLCLIVTDSRVSKLFKKNGGGLSFIGKAVPAANGTRKLTNKSVGRTFSSSQTGLRHKYEPPMNMRRRKERNFINHLCKWLDQAARKDAFDSLILVAPPRTLGELREIMPSSLQKKVVLEINKDMTKMPAVALKKELEDIIWFWPRH